MYEYDFNTYSVRRRRSKKKIYVWIGFFGFLLILFFIFFRPQSDQEKTTLGDATERSAAPLARQVHFANNPLSGIIAQSLADTQGSYAVAIVNPKTRESFMQNEHKTYQAASLYKLWVMATVFQQIEQGKLQEDDPLLADVVELNKKFSIAPDSAELTEGTLDFTVASALRQMITISHNYAALALTEKVRLSTVAKFLADNGLTQSHVSSSDHPPTTTASDTALFFTKLMNGEFANETYTTKMIDLLKAQRLNNKLPRYLPEETLIAHKTGELGLFSHDGGIVYLPDGNQYVIVVLSETVYPPAAEERISQISHNVYRYFTR